MLLLPLSNSIVMTKYITISSKVWEKKYKLVLIINFKLFYSNLWEKLGQFYFV